MTEDEHDHMDCDDESCKGVITVDWDEDKERFVVVDRVSRIQADLIDFTTDAKGRIFGIRFRTREGEWKDVPQWALGRHL